MAGVVRTILRWVAIVYVVALHAALGFFAFHYFFPGLYTARNTQIPTIEAPEASTPAPSPLPVPSDFADQITPTPTATPDTSVPADALMIPVKGIKRSQLQDTFTSSRANGRTHDAIDIMAPAGTPVVAAADGEIVKFFDSVAGGITIYQLSADKKYIYYYAHLQQRAGDIKEHDQVTRGRVIGFVGDTGNAGVGNYHLHFSIAIATDPKRYWTGTYINPYPLLMNAVESP